MNFIVSSFLYDFQLQHQNILKLYSLGQVVNNNDNECQYQGIYCNDQGKVIMIDYPYSDVTGFIPNNTFSCLEELIYLNFNQQYLYLDMQYFEWNLKLVYLSLNHVWISGQISDQICQLKQLQYLSLSNNNLYGSLPQCFSQLPIRTLFLNNNNFDNLTICSSMNIQQYNYDCNTYNYNEQQCFISDFQCPTSIEYCNNIYYLIE